MKSRKQGLRWAAGVAAWLVLGACGAAGLGGCRTSASSQIAAVEQRNSAEQIQKAASLVRDAQRLELAKDTPGAIAKYKEAIETYNELPVAWNNLGRLLMQNGDNLMAAEAFKQASELSPSDPVPVHNLGALWESLGYLGDASKWYDQALQRDPQYLPSLRRFLLVKDLNSDRDAIVGDRLKTALLLETDPWWINRFKRMHQLYEETMTPRSGVAGAGSPK